MDETDIFDILSEPQETKDSSRSHPRKGNGHIRSFVRKQRLNSHMNGKHSWRHEFYFDEEKNHLVHHKIFTPQTYWKRYSNRVVRRNVDIYNHAYYRRVVDIFDLW